MKHILLIQTAFIGDVILATPVIEAINKQNPEIKIDFLLRKGNESLFQNHPLLNQVLIWDKKSKKNKNLIGIIKTIRNTPYDVVINMQRFASTGIITVLSKSKIRIGFKNNPFSWAFSHKIDHSVNKGLHETERNLNLLNPLFNTNKTQPKLYPQNEHYTKVAQYKKSSYICAAPTSVWFTKQYPKNKWIELFNNIDKDITIYLLGAPSDFNACEQIKDESQHSNTVNLAGSLSMLESAALMQDAKMNFVNDSAPMHMASAVNASTTAIFCSTVPSFGFGPLADNSSIVEVNTQLKCRPCGLHGHKACPEGHFKCALNIDTNKLLPNKNR